MRIAARMALQGASENDDRALWTAGALQPTMRALGYDGFDVVVGAISEHGFMAETNARFPPDAFVRLKLPGAGSVFARIVSADAGSVAGEFITPLAKERLRRTIGLVPPMLAAAG
jgi:hypothetical protein